MSNFYLQNTLETCVSNSDGKHQNKNQDQTDRHWRENLFTQSARSLSDDDEVPSNPFYQSVHLMQNQNGTYQVYQVAHNYNFLSKSSSEQFETSLPMSSSNYNIKRQHQAEQLRNSNRKYSKNSHKDLLGILDDESHCSCDLYHSHTFNHGYNHSVFGCTDAYSIPSYQAPCFTDLSKRSINNFINICNTFWRPQLSFHPHKYGDVLEFSSLWPQERDLKELLLEGIDGTVLRQAVSDLCKLAVRCGPLRLLKCLLELSVIRINHQFENGSGLLHLACIAQNSELVVYLVEKGISPKIKNKNGLTADRVCYSSKIRKLLPARYLRNSLNKEQTLILKPSLQDKEIIFQLLEDPECFDEIQMQLQTLRFDVNSEYNSQGDFLLHVIAKAGIVQLPLLMSLMRIQNADIDLCNADGMSALMIAALMGNTTLCDVLICVCGADPNLPNPHSGHTVLHYAVMTSQVDIVRCLIQRGADLNAEDRLGQRADDGYFDTDCWEIIQSERELRVAHLQKLVVQGDLRSSDLSKTDLWVADQDGFTLIMLAARYNRKENLDVLLKITSRSINALHGKNGKVALSMAMEEGHVEIVEKLLSKGADPSIADIVGYLPLHYAVINNHIDVINAFLEFFPKTYTGLHLALRLCKRTDIYNKIRDAWERRQEELVKPVLFDCAVSGNAEKLYCFLEDGDNVNPKSGVGNWPLYLAAENRHLDVLQLLHENGGNIRRKHQTTGFTVLHIAAKMEWIEIVKYLVQFSHPFGPFGILTGSEHCSNKKLDINAFTLDGRTALQLAAERGYLKIVELLLKNGATTSIMDETGYLYSCPIFEGVQITIKSHQDHHMKQVMKCICERSRKGICMLGQIWLPGFDHNLRNKLGDTPLMLACKLGKYEAVEFLLQSAVFEKNLLDKEYSFDNSDDADSGVLDQRDNDEFQNSVSTSQHSCCVTELLVKSQRHNSAQEYADEQKDDTVNCGLTGPDSDRKTACWTRDTQLSALLNDATRPKRFSIYHDGLVSHVTAVNYFDGCNPLHRAIEGGDAVSIVHMLIRADPACLNMQNNKGFGPLHVACKLRRKKVVKKLLSQSDIDLNLRTLEGKLPEEMTSLKQIIKSIKQQRQEQPSRSVVEEAVDSLSQNSELSATETSICFEKLERRFEAIKKGNC